jgi:hypothetical protein
MAVRPVEWMMTSGTMTIRLPAADLGAPVTCLPLLNVAWAGETSPG